MKSYTDNKCIGKFVVENFVVGDQVWLDIQRMARTKKKTAISWVGPCEITREFGGLYDLKYQTEGSVKTFVRIHPQFMKMWKGEAC